MDTEPESLHSQAITQHGGSFEKESVILELSLVLSPGELPPDKHLMITCYKSAASVTYLT